MELEAWIKPVNSRLRLCLCRALFSLLTEEFLFCLIILLVYKLLAYCRRSESGKFISSCFLLPFAQILAETPPLSIHDSPFPANEQDTVGTFSAPPDPTGEVSCPLAPPLSAPRLPNHRCKKTNWRVTPFAPIRSCTSVRRGQTSVFFCEI